MVNEDVRIDTMAKSVGYALAISEVSHQDAYDIAWDYWKRFPRKINADEFIELVAYHKAVKELEEVTTK